MHGGKGLWYAARPRLIMSDQTGLGKFTMVAEIGFAGSEPPKYMHNTHRKRIKQNLGVSGAGGCSSKCTCLSIRKKKLGDIGLSVANRHWSS